MSLFPHLEGLKIIAFSIKCDNPKCGKVSPPVITTDLEEIYKPIPDWGRGTLDYCPDCRL